MAFTPQVNSKDAVFVQRDDSNTKYEQINISGSNAIVYLDEYGHLMADKISDWAVKYNIGSGSSSSGSSNSSISSSWASQSLSSSYSSFSLISETADFALLADTASLAIRSLTSSWLDSATNAFIQGGNSFGSTAILGTLDSQDLRVKVNNVERMFISRSGRIGIGVAAPGTSSLEVSGDVQSNTFTSFDVVPRFTFYLSTQSRESRIIFNEVGVGLEKGAISCNGSQWSTYWNPGGDPTGSYDNCIQYDINPIGGRHVFRVKNTDEFIIGYYAVTSSVPIKGTWFYGTSSWAVSSSWAPSAATSNYSIWSSASLSSSWASSSLSASFARTSSFVVSSSYARSSSWSVNTVSASYLSGSYAIVNIASASAFPPAVTYTIGNVTSATMTQDNGPYGLQALEFSYGFRIYAYWDVPGDGRIFSSNYYEISGLDDASSNTFRWSLSWSSVANASGYRILYYDTNNGYNYDYYYDYATNSGYYDGSPVNTPIVVTPTSAIIGNGDGTALYVTGSSKFYGDARFTGPVTASWFQGTASFAVSASWAPSAAPSGLTTGSTYPITASWAVSASWAPSGTATLVTGSNYPVTSSWALIAIQALNTTQSVYATQSIYAVSASWVSASVIISRSLFATSASWASSSLSSSFATSASWASSSLSSSFASNALSTLSAFTASYIGLANSASYAYTASYLTTTNNYTVNQFTASSLLSATGKFTGIVSGSSKMRVDDYIYTGRQLAFDATGGPIYFGNFESPANGRAGFSIPGEVIQGVDANSKRFGFGGGGTHFVTNGPLCLVEIRARANETQFGILGHASQTADILYVSTSAAPVFRIKATGHVTASVITASAFVPNCRTVVADYTVTGLDSTIIFSGSAPLTASLPSAVGSNGLTYNIKNVSPFTLFVTGSQKIDNNSNMNLRQWDNLSIISNNTQWYII